MKLILTISDPGQAKARSISRTLEKGSLTIGRAASADWAIDDPERLLSKLHCRVEARSGRFILTDTSTNGVFVNGAGAPVGEGKTTVLNDGDKLLLGGVTISVAVNMEAGAGRTEPILPDDYSFVDMLGKAYAKAAPAGGLQRDEPAGGSGTIGDWQTSSAGDTVPFQNQAFKPAAVQAPPKIAPASGGIPDDWMSGTAKPQPLNGNGSAARLGAAAPDGGRGTTERQYRALVAGLASYAAGNASLRAALGCSVNFANPKSLLATTDIKALQAALSSNDGAAITEVLAAGLAHQSALVTALRSALERLNGAAALEFKGTLATTYRQVFEAETRRLAGGKD